MRKIFITGISTDVGKTIVSAVLTEALEADYWKPVQTGSMADSDSHRIRELVANRRTQIHPEVYHFEQPVSPHTAAELNETEISISKINLPKCQNDVLIIEGAGGLMVPLNNKEFMVDLIQKFEAEVVLVVRNYLGSINHTLLSFEILKARKIPVLGIIFSGLENVSSETLILKYTKAKCLGRVPESTTFNKELITEIADSFRRI